MQRSGRQLKRFRSLITITTAPSAVQASSEQSILNAINNTSFAQLTVQRDAQIYPPYAKGIKLNTAAWPGPPLSARTLATTPDKSDEEAQNMEQEILEAFDNLISAAYDLANEGKPLEAEYILKEGAQQASDVLGPDNAVMVAPLYDQLAVLQFMHDRNIEAVEAAQKSLDIMRQFAADVQSPAAEGAAAAAAMRYGSILLAGGSPQEAIPLLQGAINTLCNVIGAVEQEGMLQEKFSTALGEAEFYHTLATSLLGTAIQAWEIEAVQALTPKLQNSLTLMQDYLGQHHPLLACALREHDKVVQLTLQADRFDLTEAVLKQAIQLHNGCTPDGEHVGMMLYQLGTLNYVMGKYDAAKEVLNKALSIVKGFEDGEEHAITVKHRLGLVHGALGEFVDAKALLNEIAPELIKHLGSDNPISAELNFMLALVAMNEGKQAGTLTDDKVNKLMGDMKANLKALEEYGPDHMLVRKAREQFEEVSASQ